jgi:hypothetical protein
LEVAAGVRFSEVALGGNYSAVQVLAVCNFSAVFKQRIPILYPNIFQIYSCEILILLIAKVGRNIDK